MSPISSRIRARQQDQRRPYACQNIIKHNACRAADIFIGPAHRPRLYNIEQAKQHKGKRNAERRQRRKRQGQPKTGHFINDDGRGVFILRAVNPYRAGPMAQTIGKGGGDDETGRTEMLRDEQAGGERGQRAPQCRKPVSASRSRKRSQSKRPEKAALNAPEVCAYRPLCAIRQQDCGCRLRRNAFTTPAKAQPSVVVAFTDMAESGKPVSALSFSRMAARCGPIFGASQISVRSIWVSRACLAAARASACQKIRRGAVFICGIRRWKMVANIALSKRPNSASVMACSPTSASL